MKFSLKQVRWNDKSLLNLFESPGTYKIAAIEPLLKRFPQRQFVLVGDSGERDPEIYATLARRYPQQISRILIRDVTDEPADSSRYRATFRDLAPGLWQIFRDPARSIEVRLSDRPAVVDAIQSMIARGMSVEEGSIEVSAALPPDAQGKCRLVHR